MCEKFRPEWEEVRLAGGGPSAFRGWKETSQRPGICVSSSHSRLEVWSSPAVQKSIPYFLFVESLLSPYSGVGFFFTARLACIYMNFESQKICFADRLYCKRPIQCLASSKILTPHPLTARRVCTLPPLVRGKNTLAGWRVGGGSIFWKSPDTALYSTYVSTLWSVYSNVKDRRSITKMLMYTRITASWGVRTIGQALSRSYIPHRCTQIVSVLLGSIESISA